MSVSRKVSDTSTASARVSALHDRVVAAEDAVDHQPPGAGDGEDGLGDDRAAEQRADAKAEQRHGRDQRIAQHVPEQDDAAAQALGAGEVDDIRRLQHLDDRGAQVAHQHGREAQRQGQRPAGTGDRGGPGSCRRSRRPGTSAAWRRTRSAARGRDRRPAWTGRPGTRRGSGDRASDCVSAAQKASGTASSDRDQRGEASEHQGHGQTFHDEARDRNAEREGGAEVAAPNSPEEANELGEDGLVEAELRLSRCTSSSVARSPSMAEAGSPGRSRARTKTTTRMRSRVGISCSSRVRRSSVYAPRASASSKGPAREVPPGARAYLSR